jgi:hypothetical protein
MPVIFHIPSRIVACSDSSEFSLYFCGSVSEQDFDIADQADLPVC